MVFNSDGVLPIRPLNLAVKRGRLRHLAIEMDGYDVIQVVGMLNFGPGRNSGNLEGRVPTRNYFYPCFNNLFSLQRELTVH